MLSALKPQPADKILQLIQMYRDDPREAKIDLGVGVYKDPTGLTPVMRAVKAAEAKLWQTETTKTYTGLAGEPAYAAAMATMILGEDAATARIAAIATPGGTGAIPLIDLAYQGFGDGLEEDAAATRLIAARLPEVLIAASCSKNFGIYRERTGVLMALGDPALKPTVQANLNFLNRQNFSFPPDHGARLVTMILTDAELTADWKSELEEVRLNMLTLRQLLADALRAETGSDRFGFIGQHRGMFSRLGITADQVERLRSEHGIYMVGDSRLNIAGLNRNTVPVLARAVAQVIR